MKMSKKLRIILTVVFVFLTLVIIGLIRFLSPVNNDIYANIDDVNLEEEYPEAWAELGESLKILEYGGNDFHAGDNYTFVYTDKFKEVFRKIYNGYYKDTSDEQLDTILFDKINRITTITLSAGEVYEKLKPTDGITLEAYLAELDTKLIEAKTLSAKHGYSIGDKTTTKGGVEFTYQGGDKWIDSNNVVHTLVEHEGGFHFEEENKQVASNTQNNNSSSSNKNNSSSSSNNKNSKYVSEQWGYSKGDTAQTTADGVYTYLGNDIWQSSNGTTYKARLVGSNIEFFAKSPFGVSSVTDEDGYMLPDVDDTSTEDPDKDSRDPSGWRIGTAGWHEYWDGKTVKEFHDNAGYTKLYYIVKPAEGNRLPTTEYYPDDYVIGSYALICEENIYTGEPIYGKY